MRTPLTSVLRAALTAGVLALVARPALATTLTFDDISPSCNASVGTYGGLTFSSFTTECNADYGASFANSYGSVSGDWAATNDFGAGETHVSIGSGSFSLLQASFSSFAYANAFAPFSSASLAIAGYKAGDPIGSPTYYTAFDLDPTQYVTQTFTNWDGITDLAFFTGAGTVADNIFAIDGLSWLIDDLQVDVNGTQAPPVPEPGTLTLVALGLVGAARARAARRSRA